MHSVSIGQLEVAQDTKHLLSAPFRPAAMSFRQLPQLHIRVPSHVSSLSFSSQAQSEPQEQLVSNTTIIRLLDRTVEVENEVAQVSLSPRIGILCQKQSCDSTARSPPASALRALPPKSVKCAHGCCSQRAQASGLNP